MGNLLYLREQKKNVRAFKKKKNILLNVIKK